MNLTQLSVFRHVMETGSISQAAHKLGRTQPAVSLAIKKLEATLGIDLFERRGRQMIPVPEAQYLLVEAIEILDHLTAVTGTMQSLRNVKSGSLNVAAMPGASAYFFPRFISNALADHTDFNVTFSSRSSPQIRELASTQSIDFGFADFDVSTHKTPQYASEIISADCFLAVRKGHPLGRKSVAGVLDLDGMPMGTLQGTHPMSRRIMEAFAKKGAVYQSRIESQFFLPLLPFVALGQCCVIVDPLTVATERDLGTTSGGVEFVPFDPELRYEYATFMPILRPPSQLALHIKQGWVDSLLGILTEIGANPERQDAPEMRSAD